jgi:hypothetical protein
MANGIVDHARARTTLRVLGLALLLVGVAGAVAGAVLFARGALADDIDAMGQNALVGVLLFGGGGFLAVLGVGALSAGFRAEPGYVAGGPLPVSGDTDVETEGWGSGGTAGPGRLNGPS